MSATHAESEEDKSVNRKVKSKYWTRLKKKMNRKGMIEIDIDHHRYDVLNCIREGIRHININYGENGIQHELNEEDFIHVETKTVESNKKVFEFSSHCSKVFSTIRQGVGITEEDFLNSLSPENVPYYEFLSSSRGGHNFFLSNDKAYFMKTEKKKHIDFFKGFLREYLHHFQQYPHSLLVKILGIYSIKIPGKDMLYFFVMQSIFYPDTRIKDRFDLKGCLAGRHQKISDPDNEEIIILQDHNFFEESIKLGHQKDWFLKQIEYDTDFLCDLGVSDYSLLVGRQSYHPDELHEENLGDVIRMQKKSHSPVKNRCNSACNHSNTNCQMIKENGDTGINLKEITTDVTHSEAGDVPSTNDIFQETSIQPSQTTKQSFSLVDNGNLDNDECSNRRFLPSSKNPLHVINGENYKYFVGIIDFFAVYGCRQKRERVLKSIKYFSFDHSTLPPHLYASRLIRFINEHTS